MSKIGIVLPQTEIGADPHDLRRLVTTVEELGYTHIMAYDHVVGADRSVHPDIPDFLYDIDSDFHEPLVTFGYLAAVTERIEFFTGILILPQRQTALVAKQAAEVDILSGGRLRLGVGLGWNRTEYHTLGQNFTTRGKRIEEQVTLLRRLWTERSVTYHGRFDDINGVGLSPRPQRPIPLWMGGMVPASYRRAGRLADGWFPEMRPGPDFDAAQAFVAEGAVQADRDPQSLEVLGRAWLEDGYDAVLRTVDDWRQRNVSRIAINTMKAGLTSVDAHIDVLSKLAADLGLAE